MANPYESNYGTSFDGLHSFSDFGLYPASRPQIEDVEVQTKYEEIPGMHGYLDLSEVLTGYPVYGTRDAEFDFVSIQPRSQWDAQITKIMAKLHGRRIAKIIRDEEPDVYMTGRLKVDKVKVRTSGRTGMLQIEIEGDLDPWKRDRFDSTEAWEWDSFNFETGIVREYGQIGVSGTKTLEFVSSPMGGSPEFYAEDEGITVTVDESTYQIPMVTWTVFPGIILPNDYSTVEMTFSGSGTVWVRYRGGRL